MIQKIDITGQRFDITPQLRKYIIKKIGGLDRYVSRSIRQSLYVAVKLKESKSTDKRQSTVEVLFQLPKETISVTESAINMFAGIDIVESKLRLQLRKYKDLHGESGLRHKLLRRLKKRSLNNRASTN